jgi:photosystem II stability/assembly factor-like uncharacterized protein
VVGRHGTILRTTNGGATWTAQTSPDTASLYQPCFTDANNGVVVGIKGTIIRTTDGGATWTNIPSGTTEDLYGLSFATKDIGFVTGTNGLIMGTTDGGQTWQPQSAPTVETLFSVFAIDANTAVAVGGSGIILKTTNGGAKWRGQTSPVGNRLHEVWFAGGSNGWAVGTSGVIIHTTDGGGPTGIRPMDQEGLPKILALDQNYPNPFNPSTMIRFSVPQTGFVTLKVYNVLGDEVAGLVQEVVRAGVHEVEWNAANAPSGIYLYRLTAGSSTVTRRMALVK